MRTFDDMDEQPHPADSDSEHASSSRRSFVRTAAAAAIGAVGAALITSAEPAAAAGAMQYGATNNAGGDGTILNADRDNAAAFVVDNLGTAGYGISATADYAYGGYGTKTGVFVLGGEYGAEIKGSSIGGLFTATDVDNGIGVIGLGRVGIDARGDEIGAYSDGAVLGIRANGSSVTGIGVDASGGMYGLRTAGLVANAHLEPKVGAPATSTVAHQCGELYCESPSTNTAELWFCVRSGTPGTWVRLSAPPPVIPPAPPAFHAVTPHRVYDSRWVEGPLRANEHRQVSVKDGRSLTGALDAADLVPPAARVIAYNLTISDTLGAGFLSVTPADAPTFGASAINWSSSGFVVANASTVNTDANREVMVWAGGGGHAEFIIDIVGFYV